MYSKTETTMNQNISKHTKTQPCPPKLGFWGFGVGGFGVSGARGVSEVLVGVGAGGGGGVLGWLGVFGGGVWARSFEVVMPVASATQQQTRRNVQRANHHCLKIATTVLAPSAKP